MMSEICRAITFINYHIPPREAHNVSFQYTTLGFFDGMETKNITVDYGKKGLYTLWQYILDKTANNNGLYSYQNVFCFSDDAWNHCTDQEFWDSRTDEKYPLTFVSFLQLGDYSVKEDDVKKRCTIFRDDITGELKEQGKVYVYSTIDKNDFVICMKCTDYQKAVCTIKKMHRKQKAIYSYTVFSVLTEVLGELEPSKYGGLYRQILPSICLKGVTNSYDPLGKMRLERRYHDFCLRLVGRIYGIRRDKLKAKKIRPIKGSALKPGGVKIKIRMDYKVYDILGDHDFRLIVRNVNLGKLMEQFANKNDRLLSYNGDYFRFYLFSSSLILNTNTSEELLVDGDYRRDTLERMRTAFQPKECEKLEQRMGELYELISNKNISKNEKIITCYHAIWQIIQSMKALEAAPTKKYDFLSLYYPLRSLVDILGQKFLVMDSAKLGRLMEKEEIFEFIHKISMTIHGTLRTDIQFFQIRDFNTILHYAPAKLRAFYTLWTWKVKDYYNLFMGTDKNNEYSFIFSPGMFSGTSVRQLFENYDETHRLMLITVPERHLYVPRWLTIMLAHETSHFVGWKIRNRKQRERALLKCCAKALFLEVRKYILSTCLSDFKEYQGYIVDYFKENNSFETLITEQLEKEWGNQIKDEPYWPHQFHSKNSFQTIRKSFRDFGKIFFGEACAGECGRISEAIRKGFGLKKCPLAQAIAQAKETRDFVLGVENSIGRFFNLFADHFLMDFMECCYYISTETYADLNAILTLDLTPQDYLVSFFSCELERSNLESDRQGFNILLPYRIALSVMTIMDVISDPEYKQWMEVNEEDFYKAWSGKVFERLPQEFEFGSTEAKLAIECYYIIHNLKNYSSEIEKYKPAFKAEEFIFDWKDYNLFQEEGIWNSFLVYLEKCVGDYLSILMKEDNIQKKKRMLVDTYKKISGVSSNRMVQEIEDFLARVSEEYMNGG